MRCRSTVLGAVRPLPVVPVSPETVACLVCAYIVQVSNGEVLLRDGGMPIREGMGAVHGVGGSRTHISNSNGPLWMQGGELPTLD